MNKKYWTDKIIYSGVPGCDIYEALKEAFSDYYASKDKHHIEINLNGITVTMKKTGY